MPTNFELKRASDKILLFDGGPNGSVTGWTTVFTARKTASAPDPPDLSIAGTIVSAGSPSTPGVFQVVITKAQAQALSPRTYAWSLKRTDPGAEDVLEYGKFTVIPDIRTAL